MTSNNNATYRSNGDDLMLTSTAVTNATKQANSVPKKVLVGNPAQMVLDTTNLPPRFDWRERGFVTAVQNQKSCGACYAFSIAHTVEAQLFRRTGVIVPLSTQQLLDCSTEAGNHGCAGGSLRNTLRYVELSSGLMRDQDYPYVSAVKRHFNHYYT